MPVVIAKEGDGNKKKERVLDKEANSLFPSFIGFFLLINIFISRVQVSLLL